jgi:UPF0716 protein FxsA
MLMGRLLILFIVPLLELYILIKIGGYLGAFQTVALVVLTALFGIVITRIEGLRKLQQIKQSLSQGIVPAEEMVDGVLIVVAGILLIIPGVLTDLFALVLLIPYTRTIFKRWLRRRFDRMLVARNVRLQYYGRN